MSSITFISPETTSHVSGAEYAHARLLPIRIALSALDLDDPDYARQLVRGGFVPQEAFMSFGRKSPAQAFAVWAGSIFGDSMIRVGGEQDRANETALNTAVVMGSDAVALLARLGAFTEAHLYVEGTHRAWLAEVITAGRTSGVLRAEMGWEQVIEHLLADDSQSVVTAFSGSDSFPMHQRTDRVDEWSEPIYEQMGWEQAMDVLRQSWWLQLTPQNLHQPAFSKLHTFIEVDTEVRAGMYSREGIR